MSPAGRCSACGADIPEELIDAPCPSCGATEREKYLAAEVTAGAEVSAHPSFLREFFEQHPGYRWGTRIVGAVGIASSLLGFWPGIIVGVVAFGVSDILGGRGWRRVTRLLDDPP